MNGDLWLLNYDSRLLTPDIWLPIFDSRIMTPEIWLRLVVDITIVSKLLQVEFQTLLEALMRHDGKYVE